jgi:hypothetical protein
LHSADRRLDPELLKVIQALEESLWHSTTRFDHQLMDQTFSEDFFEFGRSGRQYCRKEMFLDPQSSNEILATLPFPEFHARYITDDVIQVTYISEAIYDGVILRANRSSIWSCHNGRWLLRFHQGTPVDA